MTQYLSAATLKLGNPAATIELEDIIYVAVRMVGVGPNGDHLSFQFTPNYLLGTGEYHHGKYWEIIVGLDENAYTALFETDVDTAEGGHYAIEQADENFAINVFLMTFLDNNQGVITWKWTVDTIFAARYSIDINNMGGNPQTTQPTEVIFKSRGIRTVILPGEFDTICFFSSTEDGPRNVKEIFSEDYGGTWINKLAVSSEAEVEVWPFGIQLANDEILAVYGWDAYPDMYIRQRRSVDEGVTYGASSDVIHNYERPQIVQLANGDLIMVITKRNTFVAILKSEDNGLTWTTTFSDLFSENFESYTTGSSPPWGSNWILYAGVNYAKIVETNPYSGTKSIGWKDTGPSECEIAWTFDNYQKYIAFGTLTFYVQVDAGYTSTGFEMTLRESAISRCPIRVLGGFLKYYSHPNWLNHAAFSTDVYHKIEIGWDSKTDTWWLSLDDDVATTGIPCYGAGVLGGINWLSMHLATGAGRSSGYADDFSIDGSGCVIAGTVRQASMILLENGELVCAMQTAAGVGTNNIYCYISGDSGKTWGSGISIATTGTLVTASLVQLVNGDVICFYSKWVDVRYYIYCKKSTDNCRTWGAETLVYDGAGHGLGAYALVDPVTDKIFMVFYTNEDGTYDIKILFSEDDGATWGDKQVVDASTNNQNQPSLAKLDK